MQTVPDATTADDLFRRPPDRLLDVGGGAAVAHRAVGDGPDVLFVHGWPVSGATFRGLLPHLAPHVRCHVLDLPGTGHSRFTRATTLDLPTHVATLRRTLDRLGLDDVAVVGHDSGGLLARHAFAGDERLRALGLIATEQPQGLHWRFRSFLLPGRLPGFAHALAWVAGRPRLRRGSLLFGELFDDRELLDGTFDEFVLGPLRDDPARRWAAGALVRCFDTRFVDELADVHARVTCPVQLVWGADDPFFPVAWAREMVDTFPDASLTVVPDAKLFVHEERPAAVATALLPALLGRHR